MVGLTLTKPPSLFASIACCVLGIVLVGGNLAIGQKSVRLNDEQFNEVLECLNLKKNRTNWVSVFRDLNAEQSNASDYAPEPLAFRLRDFIPAYPERYGQMLLDEGPEASEPLGIIFVVPSAETRLRLFGEQLDVFDPKMFDLIQYSEDQWEFSILSKSMAPNKSPIVVISMPWKNAPSAHHLKTLLAGPLDGCPHSSILFSELDDYYG